MGEVLKYMFENIKVYKFLILFLVHEIDFGGIKIIKRTYKYYF